MSAATGRSSSAAAGGPSSAAGPGRSGLVAWVDAVGLIGPGLADWPAARRALLAAERFAPAPTAATLPPILPPAERRRTSLAVRVALASGHQAIAASSFAAPQLHSVFASSGGDGVTCHLICEALAGADRRVSPTQFHNSVHNAPSGYWGIAMHATTCSTSLCAYDASFAAGLIDAMALLADRAEPVLLIAYDAPYPEPLRSCRPITDAFGLALVLAPTRSRPDAVGLSLQFGTGEPTTLADPALEALRRNIPTARALPLLRQLALGAPGLVTLDYLPPVLADSAPTRLRIEVVG
ncbi:MAG: beta-ketoacyl synthase chain length factor [Lautropia sp.]